MRPSSRRLLGSLDNDDLSTEDLQYLIEEIIGSIDVFWVLAGSCLVFFMQIGFSMLEVGSVQEKSTKNVLIKNMFDVSVSAICWSLVGHGLAFGHSADGVGVLPGTTGFAFGKNTSALEYAHWFFQWAFVSTAATIVSGAVAERINLKVYLAFAFLLSLLIYPVVVHWTWSEDGFMSATRKDPLFGCGVLDFAGSGVVHVTGGASALIAILLLGPRDGVTFKQDAADEHKGGRRIRLFRKLAPAGQSDALKTLGTLSLWFGWFGFNGCSTGYLVGSARVSARAMCLTAVSGAMGGLTSTVLTLKYRHRHEQIHITPALNGILAGLVGMTANCATVELEGALLVGFGSACAYVGCHHLLNRFQIDDVVDAVPVHLAGGVWGMLSAGLLTKPSNYEEAFARSLHESADAGDMARSCAGLFYGGSGQQLAANVVFLLVNLLWVVSTGGALFLVAHRKGALRVARLVEQVGLDQMLHNDEAGHGDEDEAMEDTMGHGVASIQLTAPVVEMQQSTFPAPQHQAPGAAAAAVPGEFSLRREGSGAAGGLQPNGWPAAAQTGGPLPGALPTVEGNAGSLGMPPPGSNPPGGFPPGLQQMALDRSMNHSRNSARAQSRMDHSRNSNMDRSMNHSRNSMDASIGGRSMDGSSASDVHVAVSLAILNTAANHGLLPVALPQGGEGLPSRNVSRHRVDGLDGSGNGRGHFAPLSRRNTGMGGLDGSATGRGGGMDSSGTGTGGGGLDSSGTGGGGGGGLDSSGNGRGRFAPLSRRNTGMGGLDGSATGRGGGLDSSGTGRGGRGTGLGQMDDSGNGRMGLGSLDLSRVGTTSDGAVYMTA